MKIEILYPELCGMFGDGMNMTYLSQCIPEAEIIKTSLKSRPQFVDGNVDMIYMGFMTEHSQELVCNALREYKARISELIEGGTMFLITGNAMEIFGQYIEKDDGTRIEMLGIFDTYAKRRMYARYNAFYVGKFGDIDVVGFKSQFSHSYGGEGIAPLFDTVKGDGRSPGTPGEGIRVNNFMATYLMGPLLVLNPSFTEHIMEKLGARDRPSVFAETARAAYEKRLAQFMEPTRNFLY